MQTNFVQDQLVNQTLNNIFTGPHGPVPELLCCLIPVSPPPPVCCFRSSLKKTGPGYENRQSGSREAVPEFWVTYSHATHVASGPWEAEGSSPAGQVTQSSQGITTTICASPSMFTAAPGLNGFHMAPRHPRHNLCATHKHTRDTHS